MLTNNRIIDRQNFSSSKSTKSAKVSRSAIKVNRTLRKKNKSNCCHSLLLWPFVMSLVQTKLWIPLKMICWQFELITYYKMLFRTFQWTKTTCLRWCDAPMACVWRFVYTRNSLTWQKGQKMNFAELAAAPWQIGLFHPFDGDCMGFGEVPMIIIVNFSVFCAISNI